jgi:dihydrofolate synthase/folylpolyglutamate synthase
MTKPDNNEFGEQEIADLLQSFARFGVELGLERITALLQDLGNPQQRVPLIHVAGSNGKGSVCAYLSAVLTRAGYRVGRYTSPHLVSWTERICVGDRPISPHDLYQILLQVCQPIAPNRPSPTQFEVITAAAWLYFAQQQVDVAVMEVGLGGRLDATNVCDRPLVSIITSLSREHWQRLGPTLADISREKAGILKPNCPAVLAPLPPEAEPVVMGRVAALGCPVVSPLPSEQVGNGWAVYRGEGRVGRGSLVSKWVGDEDSLVGLRYPLPLPGAHQLVNSALAIAALDMLRNQGWQIPATAIAAGMARAKWPGRLQWLPWRGQPILVDGAHNPAAAKVLRHYVDVATQVRSPVHWVMGMLATKDHADIFKTLLRAGDSLYLVPVPDHQFADPTKLAELAQAICPKLTECRTFTGESTALDHALATSTQTDGTVILCGSLYLIGHFFQHHQNS